MSEPIKNRDIVIVGQQPWDTGIGSNCKNIGLEFSKYNRVLYVNSALDRVSLLKGKNDPKVQKRLRVIKGQENGLVPLQNNLWNLYPDCLVESINWLKVRAAFRLLNKRNNRLFAVSIQKAMAALGFKDIILFNDNDMFRSFYLKELLQPKTSIYYSRDFMLGVDYWKFHGEEAEPQLIAKSDLCTANSTYLADYCRQYNPRSYYVGQGCETELFMQADQQPMPGDMRHIAHPIIGYVGALQSIRLDIPLLEYIAKHQPEWQIVLVGPEDAVFTASSLHQFNNVHFLGSKSPIELPAYCNAFDVCINPQLVNPVTIGNYPRKIDEYLAAGKPVVATNTPAMGIFEPHVYLANTQADYLTLITQALQESPGERVVERKAFAATHTWENSVQMIYDAVRECESAN